MATEKCEECKESIPLLIQASGGKQVYAFATHYKIEGRCNGSGRLSGKVVKT